MGARHMEQLERILDGSIEPQDIRLSVLEEITEDFSEERIIGKGGFGDVYKGILRNGEVAVKRLKNNPTTIDDKLFRREVDVLRMVNHQNIVRFLGFCSATMHKVIEHGGPGQYVYAEIRERLLCFEYINNGSLDKYITDELRGVDWNTRYDMIKGICEGLQYLHVERHLLHLDLKPANILVDNHMVAKIADFGLSRMDEYTHTKSRILSLGYCAPEYQFNGNMSVKSDMYSLGVIIMELVTGHKGTPNKNNVLRRWRHRGRKSGKETPFKYLQISKLIDIGLLCQDNDPYKRPFISQVISDVKEVENLDGKISNANKSSDEQISPYSDDDMLGIEPLELQFPFEINKKLSCSVELTNETKSYIAFTIQTMSHLPYCMQPGKGIVQPQSRRSVNITLQPMDRSPPLGKQHTGDLIVRSTKVNKILRNEDINEDIFNIEEGKVVDVVSLTVEYYADVPKVDLNSPDESYMPSAELGSRVIDFPNMNEKKQYTSSDDSSLQSGSKYNKVSEEELTIAPQSSEGSSSGTLHVDVDDKAPQNSDDSDLGWSRPTHVHISVEDQTSLSGMEPESVQLVVRYGETIPWEGAFKQRVMLELTGGDCTSGRLGLDLVLVFDIFWMDHLKNAIRFVLQKLGPMDRLSILIFSDDNIKEVCPLRQITEASRLELEEVIHGLKLMFEWSADVKRALRTGLKVLAGRKVKADRVAAIMLVCSCYMLYKDVEAIVSDVPVYTFGVGALMIHDYEDLSMVVANSKGGTFSYIEAEYRYSGGLTMALSQCLAGLLTVSAQDIELTLRTVQDESKLLEVKAGTRKYDVAPSSVTIGFDDLYSREVRRVIVHLELPSVHSKSNEEILTVTCSYRSSSSRGGLTVRHSHIQKNYQYCVVTAAEILMEENRLRTIEQMKGTTKWYEEAYMHVENKQVDPLFRIDMLEVLGAYHESARGYYKPIIPYYWALMISHERARYAARGDMEKIRIFATPRMDMYLEQAKKFFKDPAMRLPSADDDAKEELGDPFKIDVARREEELQRLRLDIQED